MSPPIVKTKDLVERIVESITSFPFSINNLQKKLAERKGFEPLVEETPYNGFRDRRLQPLSHLSRGKILA